MICCVMIMSCDNPANNELNDFEYRISSEISLMNYPLKHLLEENNELYFEKAKSIDTSVVHYRNVVEEKKQFITELTEGIMGNCGGLSAETGRFAFPYEADEVEEILSSPYFQKEWALFLEEYQTLANEYHKDDVFEKWMMQEKNIQQAFKNKEEYSLLVSVMNGEIDNMNMRLMDIEKVLDMLYLYILFNENMYYSKVIFES